MELPLIEIVLELGSFQILKKHEAGLPYEYMWRDDSAPMGFGPFFSIEETCRHYCEVKKLEKLERIVKATEKNVIHVDFMQKKRIS